MTTGTDEESQILLENISSSTSTTDQLQQNQDSTEL